MSCPQTWENWTLPVLIWFPVSNRLGQIKSKPSTEFLREFSKELLLHPDVARWLSLRPAPGGQFSNVHQEPQRTGVLGGSVD